jgi:hypothetical protein
MLGHFMHMSLLLMIMMIAMNTSKFLLVDRSKNHCLNLDSGRTFPKLGLNLVVDILVSISFFYASVSRKFLPDFSTSLL